jgi:hypothetical protein
MSAYKAILLKWTGDKELAAKLDSLARGVGSTIARKAVRAGISVISKAQKSAAPNNRFRRALGTRIRKASAKAGIGVGKKNNRLVPGRQIVSTMPQARLLILGTKSRHTKKGALRGQIRPGTQWVKSASEGAIPAATRAMSEAAWSEIEKLANGK